MAADVPLRSVFLLVCTAVMAACGAGSGTALTIGDSVAPDFRALAETTLDQFVSAAPYAASCMGDVRLEAAVDLDDLARYSAATGTITVRVPATAPSLRDSLVHELAHHVEATCAAHEELRPEFLAAQGNEPSTPWFEAATWEETPSEVFAEAVVMAILDGRRRNLGRVHITPEAQQVVDDWLGAG